MLSKERLVDHETSPHVESQQYTMFLKPANSSSDGLPASSNSDHLFVDTTTRNSNSDEDGLDTNLNQMLKERCRRRRSPGHAGLGRRAHPLQRPGLMGSVPEAIVVARRHLGCHGQLRRQLCTDRTRSPRLAN